jgi:hypothetical protein
MKGLIVIADDFGSNFIRSNLINCRSGFCRLHAVMNTPSEGRRGCDCSPI